MIKEVMVGKSLLAVGAAVVFTGAALYAVGQTLDYLFRDVNQDKIEQKEEAEGVRSEGCTDGRVEGPDAENMIADPV